LVAYCLVRLCPLSWSCQTLRQNPPFEKFVHITKLSRSRAIRQVSVISIFERPIRSKLWGISGKLDSVETDTHIEEETEKEREMQRKDNVHQLPEYVKIRWIMAL
jgi:hypothetical protein